MFGGGLFAVALYGQDEKKKTWPNVVWSFFYRDFHEGYTFMV